MVGLLPQHQWLPLDFIFYGSWVRGGFNCFTRHENLCESQNIQEHGSGDMDVNAGAILSADKTLEEVSKEIVDLSLAVAAGQQTKSEALGHSESVLLYKGKMADKTLC